MLCIIQQFMSTIKYKMEQLCHLISTQLFVCIAPWSWNIEMSLLLAQRIIFIFGNMFIKHVSVCFAISLRMILKWVGGLLSRLSLEQPMLIDLLVHGSQADLLDDVTSISSLPKQNETYD